MDFDITQKNLFKLISNNEAFETLRISWNLVFRWNLVESNIFFTISLWRSWAWKNLYLYVSWRFLVYGDSKLTAKCNKILQRILRSNVSMQHLVVQPFFSFLFLTYCSILISFFIDFHHCDVHFNILLTCSHGFDGFLWKSFKHFCF